MSQCLQKSTAALMIFIALANTVFIILIYHPQKAQAQWLCWDIPHTIGTIGGWIKSAAHWVWEGVKWAADKAWDKIVWLYNKKTNLFDWLWETTLESGKKALAHFRKQTLNYVVNHLTNYIQYGGREGGPSFIPDWKTFLYGTGGARDQAAGEFANTFWQNITAELAPEAQAAMESAGISTTNLCEIEPGSWTGLVGIGAGAPVQTFTSEDVACTAREAKKNLKQAKEKLVKFYDNFGDDGWDTWLEVSQVPQNNPYGFYLTVLDKKMGIEAETTEAEKAKAIAGTGWLGKEQCTTYVNNIEDRKPKITNIEYDTATGNVIGLDWLTILNNSAERPMKFDRLRDDTQEKIEDKVETSYVWRIDIDPKVREEIIAEDAQVIWDTLQSGRPNSNDYTCTNYKVLTPGQLIGQSVAKQFGGEIDWLMSTDEMEQYTTALATAGINRLFSEGRGLLGKWLGTDEEAQDLEDQFEPHPDAPSNEKARKAFTTARENYEKFTDYQESLTNPEKQKEISRVAETPAEELLFALEALEKALGDKLQPQLKELKKFQSPELITWQERALSALLAYHMNTKQTYYFQRFGPEGGRGKTWELLEGEKESCINETLDNEYYTKHRDIGQTNPKVQTGQDANNKFGVYTSLESIDLISRDFGEVIDVTVEYGRLFFDYFPKVEDYCDKGAALGLGCVQYKYKDAMPDGILKPKNSTEDRAIIQEQINAIGPWVASIKDAKKSLTTEIHAGLNYLQLHAGYTDIYEWATSINSQDKVVLTPLELQGLERLEGIYSYLANWREIWDDPTKGPDKLEESLNEDEYARTQEFMETAYCRTGETCTDDDVIEEARQKMIAMSDEAKQILDNAEQYANSVESPSGTKIDFYKEQIGLNRFQNALEGNEQGIILAGAKVLSSTSAELNEYLGIESQNLCARCVDINSNFLLECVISYWEETAESSGLSEDELDAIFKELETYVKAGYTTIKPDAFEPTTKLKLCDDACAKEIKASQICEENETMPALTLAELIEKIQNTVGVVKEQADTIKADLKETSYSKMLQSAVDLYNSVADQWYKCMDKACGAGDVRCDKKFPKY